MMPLAISIAIGLSGAMIVWSLQGTFNASDAEYRAYSVGTTSCNIGESNLIWTGGNASATANIYNSTISGNTATNRDGGGFWNDGTLTISQNTISGNTATNGDGGGVWTDSGAILNGDETNNAFQNNNPDNIFVAPP